MGKGGLTQGPAHFGLEGLGKGLSGANRPALVKEARQGNDFGEPKIPSSASSFPREVLAKVGACGRGQNAKTRTRG